MQELYTIGEVLERRECDPEIGDMFRAFAREESTWVSGDMPDRLTLRFQAAAMQWASEYPQRWRAYRLRYLQGRSVKEISRLLTVSVPQVYKLLAPVRYSEMADKIIDTPAEVKETI